MSTDDNDHLLAIHCDQTVGEALEYGQTGPDADGLWALTVAHPASGLALRYRWRGADPTRVLAKMAIEVENLVEALAGFEQWDRQPAVGADPPPVEDLWAKHWGGKK